MQSKIFVLSVVLVVIANIVSADVYLHSPRGSNDRLDDNNRDRNNGNRLFDSQNNNRGGYNVGNVYYYAGSVVPMEWTNQHSCGGSNNNCEMIIQYMCDPLLRDGTVTTTIPDDPTQCYNYNCDTDVRFGRQESYAYYQTCKNTQRNFGLFTSSQNLQGSDARFTRQNPIGDRHGYECPEERDYYPYWRPSPWIDVAILTNQPERCAAYQAESQNVVGRYYCSPPADWITMMVTNGHRAFIPITQAACEAISYYDPLYNQTVYGNWMYQAPWGVPAPDCRDTQWTRDNHLGNVPGTFGNPASYNWTVSPNFISERCAFRLRYNVSTNDFDHFEANTRLADWGAQYITGNLSSADSIINNYNNSGYVHDTNYDPANLNITYSKFGLTYAENAASFNPNTNRNTATLKASREYVLKDDPDVNIFGSLLPNLALKLQLAINTAQYGRTFQDRTHRFAIRTPPAGITGVIHNVQVRGKRGNIVQVFPGVEYDFFPNSLDIQIGDYVHFQWTGSNNNPQNNDGQGNPGTDRSNVVGLRPPTYFENQGLTIPTTVGQFGNSYPVHSVDTIPFLGLSHSNLVALATLDVTGSNMGGSMDLLDDAGTYFDLGPVPATAMGVFHYMCTRNNNFSNRSQKAVIVVGAGSTNTNAIGIAGGAVSTAGASLAAVAGAFGSLQIISISATPSQAAGASLTGNIVSSIVSVSNFNAATGNSAGLSIPYKPFAGALGAAPQMYYASDVTQSWSTISSSCSNNVCTAQISQGGNYALKSDYNIGAIIGVIVGGLIFIALIAYCLFKPNAIRKVLLPNSEDPLNQRV